MIWIILFVILIVAYTVIENRLILRVRHEDLGGNIKIAHVSDLHKRQFGKNNKLLCKRICAEKPDLILISGDFISRSTIDFSTAHSTLISLCKIAPVYMIFGNHEADLSPEYKEKFIQTVISSGAVLLNNRIIRIEIRGKIINLCGLKLPYSVYKKNGSYRGLDSVDAAEINKLLGNKPEGETILMVHNPLFAEEYAKWGADYAVCGHVHGGAFMIPFTKIGLLSPERKFLPKYTKGIYTLSNMRLLLSGGLGKLRLFNPPEIVIYKL